MGVSKGILDMTNEQFRPLDFTKSSPRNSANRLAHVRLTPF